MTASAPPSARAGHGAGTPGPASGPARPLVITGAIAACTAAGTGLVLITLLVLAGWIAAPHAGLGLPGVLRTAADLWLVGHHVGFTLHAASHVGGGSLGAAKAAGGRIGMLPLGLVLLPGALLWLAGRWVVKKGEVSRLPEVGYAALALAVPYALLAGALALLGQSSLATPSLAQAVLSGFLIALVAGGLGGARALAPVVAPGPSAAAQVPVGVPRLARRAHRADRDRRDPGRGFPRHPPGRLPRGGRGARPRPGRRRAAAPHPDRICA